MRRCAALLAVVLACPVPGRAQVPDPPPVGSTPSGPPPAANPPSAGDHPSPSPGDVSRIRQRLETATPIRDAAVTRPTFRASVTERADRFDVWKFWGEPDEVAAYVRARGGTWHQEFQDMVTPDVIKNGGAGLGNTERLQLALTGLAFAGAMKLFGMGMQQARDGMQTRSQRKAKEEVQRELEAFYALHPEARPAAPATPP